MRIVGNLEAGQRSTGGVRELRVKVAALSPARRGEKPDRPIGSGRRRSRTEVIDAVTCCRTQVGAAHLRRGCTCSRIGPHRADGGGTIRPEVDRQRRGRCRADRVERLRVWRPGRNSDRSLYDCKRRDNGDRHCRAHKQRAKESGAHEEPPQLGRDQAENDSCRLYAVSRSSVHHAYANLE